MTLSNCIDDFILYRDLVGMATMWITLAVLLATCHVVELQGESVMCFLGQGNVESFGHPKT